LNAGPRRRIARYRLVRRIGRGGSGEVFLARLEAAGGVHRLAAIKVLFHAADDPRHHEALLAEARLGALLCHPNIAQVFDAGVDDGLSWFAMEFVPGLSFFELLNVGDKLPPWLAARIVADGCAAVHALHEAADERGKPLNVVHRDVTPHNLLVSWDGNVKLVDLGVAHSALRASVTRTGVIKGKLGYMSPEQASGAAVDRRCDVFALGVQLWEALAGRRLFKGQTDSETLASIVRGDVPSLRSTPGIPASLAEVTARALAIDPNARFATALEMQRSLTAALGAAGVIIGAPEVAELLAHVAPGRVAEHIRWLSETESEPRLVATPSEAQPRSAGPRRRRRSVVTMVGALAVASMAAMGLAMRRPAADRSPVPAPVPVAIEATVVRPETAVAKANPVPPPATAQAVATAAAQRLAAEERPRAKTERRDPNRKGARAGAAPRSVPSPTGTATLYVNATPTWATIMLDGKPVGTTPIVLNEVAAGRHTVVAQPLGKGPSMRRELVLETGKTARIGFEVAPAPDRD
jgi:serine/threonine-protein kinase